MDLASYFHSTYLPKLSAKGVSVTTVADYTRVVRSAPRELTVDSVTHWLAEMTAPPASRNKRRRYLLAILRDARDHGLVGDWIERVPMAYEQHVLPRAWRIDEFERLLAACETLHERYDGIDSRLWWQSFLITLWYTGLRVQSLLEALEENIDLHEGVIVVHSPKQRAEIVYILPDDARHAIHRIWWRRRHVWPWPYTDRKKTLLRRMRQLLEVAELPQLAKPFHAIRRSVASYVTASAGIHLACEALGHSREAITRRYYVDPRIAKPVRMHGQSMPRPKIPTDVKR